jgi:hypothetical protein
MGAMVGELRRKAEQMRIGNLGVMPNDASRKAYKKRTSDHPVGGRS